MQSALGPRQGPRGARLSECKATNCTQHCDESDDNFNASGSERSTGSCHRLQPSACSPLCFTSIMHMPRLWDQDPLVTQGGGHLPKPLGIEFVSKLFDSWVIASRSWFKQPPSRSRARQVKTRAVPVARAHGPLTTVCCASMQRRVWALPQLRQW